MSISPEGVMRVYLFSPIPYSYLHQRPQKIAEELRRRSIAVTFVEPYGLTERLAHRKRSVAADVIRSLVLHLRSVIGLLVGGRVSLFSGRGERGKRPGPFEILALPLVVPQNRVNSRLVEGINAAVYRLWLSKTFSGPERLSEKRVALVEHPFFGKVIRQGDFDAVAYDCIDDLSVFAGLGSAERLAEVEQRLCSIAHCVFVTSGSLEHRMRSVYSRREPIRVPNAVDAEMFHARIREGQRPSDLPPVGRKIAGYMGIIRDWLDCELISSLARSFPEIVFVLVGPGQSRLTTGMTAANHNVLFLGRKKHADVPLYINAFDVCMIPFREGSIAESTNPVKVFEYLALGKPIVSTWLPELVTFSEEGLLRMAHTHDEFHAALRTSLEEGDPLLNDKRIHAARQNSWAHRVNLIVENLGSLTSV